MKTPMQDLIEFSNELILSKGDKLSAFVIHNKVMAKAGELLEKEKQCIIDAYNAGEPTSWTEAEQYYNETFNNINAKD